MKNFSDVFTALRKKNRSQYLLLAGCCFFSVLLITAYVCMMRSPTVLKVLPEGGDSRKQVMMIFVLAVVGCGVFTTYASGLFFRYKSRETGIFLALGASRRKLRRQLIRELAVISFISCAAGAVLGTPLAWLLWRFFRLVVVDTQEMVLGFDSQAYLYSLAFSVFVVIMLFFMMVRFIRRTNIMDVVYETRKSEPIKEIPRWYGPVGIVLLFAGILLGYLTPTFCVMVLQWFAPEWLTAPAYLPAFIGLYMILLHTVVNGWRQGRNRYKHIISTSMMKFQGRQTVRNMLVITVLVAGAYFASFYTPMSGTGSMTGYAARPVDYAFRYRSDQNMLTEQEIRQIADEEGVAITSYITGSVAVLGIDGEEMVEREDALGTTYTMEYRELRSESLIMSESTYNALTGDSIQVSSGFVMAVYSDEGDIDYLVINDVTLITNPVTREVLHVVPCTQVLRYSMLIGCRVLDDDDYTTITRGLTQEWLEEQVFFNVENVGETYDFAKRLFHAIVDRSGSEVELTKHWDAILKLQYDAAGEPYFMDKEHLEEYGFQPISYEQKDSSSFRLYWKYMPQFRILDQADHVKNFAVFLMLFIFIAIICFAAVIVIAYTRSLTIGLTNAQVYDDLRHLGASNSYLLATVRKQISRVYFVPITAGTAIIYALYMIIMFFNDGGSFTRSELAGLGNCLLVIAGMSVLLYGIYRITLRKVCGMLGVKAK